ncbi:hypothetical protein [Phytoactinopolyspora mesophila]|uniref:Uncharacterized protein n=1 Tax=Phytoactinopolyspora mesophila TaxID=2650750 RepID=A0A7K3M6M7_9ACTN|nr:hypothetical protein [Phytoactinopolyspora mesophila]NDL58905.1 hypothetical protein [Phytoactinopolyspora mesophila]
MITFLAGVPMVVFALSFLLHALLVLSVLAFIYLLFRLVTQPGELQDRYLLAAMVLVGGMVDLAVNASGVTLAGAAVDGLSDAGALGVVLSAIPAAALGGGVGWLVTRRRIWKDKKRVVRILVFLGTIATIEFMLVYAHTIQEEGLSLGPSIVPNVAFVVTAILYLALTSDPDPRTHTIRRRGQDGPFIPR